MKILVVGDSYYDSAAFRVGLSPLDTHHEIDYIDVKPETDFVPRTESERRLMEYEGSPDQVEAALSDHDVLVVHGAPVSSAVLKASPRLRLVCCARGGPVNVDVETANQMGIEVSTTPGKNAPAVAELTIALAVMLTRQVIPAFGYLRSGGRLSSTFDGARFFGSELSGRRLGIVGFGRVGREVCTRALAFGMTVLGHDPFVEDAVIENAGANPVELLELIRNSDIVSLHARQTAENYHFVDAKLLGSFKPISYLINTAREDLVDEAAVIEALDSGTLGGIAVDVFHDNGPIARALVQGDHRIVALPHVGGATEETIHRASKMIVDRIGSITGSAR